MTDDLIPAATLLLLRDAPAFEVLMIERHADIGFAGGALVFPGGKIDDADQNAAWADHCDGWSAIDGAERAPRVAAIREAFEETGVLLARNDRGDMIEDAQARAYDGMRSLVEKDAARFLELMEREKLRLACDALRLFARWQPPQAARHRRYQTWFFAALTPRQTAREDGNEATEVLWTEPRAALAARDLGTRRMIFPTARNVELLNMSENAQDAFDFARRRRIAPIEPKIVERDGETFVTIPDDLGYPVTEESAEKAFRS